MHCISHRTLVVALVGVMTFDTIFAVLLARVYFRRNR